MTDTDDIKGFRMPGFKGQCISARCPSCSRLVRADGADLTVYTPEQGLAYFYLISVPNRYLIEVQCTPCEVTMPLFLHLTPSEMEAYRTEAEAPVPEKKKKEKKRPPPTQGVRARDLALPIES